MELLYNMNPFGASVHAVIGLVAGSPNPIEHTDVSYMLPGNRLTEDCLRRVTLTLSHDASWVPFQCFYCSNFENFVVDSIRRFEGQRTVSLYPCS